jgi:hypothetical protein
MKIKTTELQGEALAWAVADCEGELSQHGGQVHLVESKVRFYEDTLDIQYTPPTDWSQGGPIIEREGISLETMAHDEYGDGWLATLVRGAVYMEFAPTPLIAAMRCYVASKMGDEIELPEEVK